MLQAPEDLADGIEGHDAVFCPDGMQAIAGGGRGEGLDSEETAATSSRPAISRVNAEPPISGQCFWAGRSP